MARPSVKCTESGVEWYRAWEPAMRTALIPFILLLTTSLSAQRPAHGGAGAPAPQQTHPSQRPSAPPAMPSPAPPRTVAPPIVFPMGPLTAPPAGGLTPPVTFVPGTGTVPPRDIFLNGRRNPYRNYGTSPLGGYGGYGFYVTEPNAGGAAAVAPAPAGGGVLRRFRTPAGGQGTGD